MPIVEPLLGIAAHDVATKVQDTAYHGAAPSASSSCPPIALNRQPEPITHFQYNYIDAWPADHNP